MRYKLFFPAPNGCERHHSRCAEMLDYILGESPNSRAYLCVYEGEVFPTASPSTAALNIIWTRHNVGDDEDGNRPRPTEIRSMCIGDIVLFEDARSAAWIADRVGWDVLEELPEGVAWEATVV